MKLINKSRNTVLGEDFIIADTPLARIKGLLGVRELKEGQALILKPCNSIHTLFMAFPIDVLFVDKHNKVLDAIPSFKPFRISRIYLKSALVVELPQGTLASTSTHTGDTLSIEGHP